MQRKVTMKIAGMTIKEYLIDRTKDYFSPLIWFLRFITKIMKKIFILLVKKPIKSNKNTSNDMILDSHCNSSSFTKSISVSKNQKEYIYQTEFTIKGKISSKNETSYKTHPISHYKKNKNYDSNKNQLLAA